MRAFKYLSPLIIYIGALQAFTYKGLLCFVPMFYAWVVIPLLELFVRPDPANMELAEEELAKKDRIYDYILHLIVIIQVPTLFYFLYSMQDPSLTIWDKIGRIGAMGLLCGTFGINVGHELGHRVNKF